MTTLTSHNLCLKDSSTFNLSRPSSTYGGNRAYIRWRSPQAAVIPNFHLPMRSYEVKNRTNVDDIKAITAIKTPYLPDGRFDLEAYDALEDIQINGGVEAVILGGTTGEGQLMSWDEQMMLIGHTVNCFRSNIKVIGNTGSNSTREAIHATEQGFAVGMHAALQVNPYYGNTSMEGLNAHFESVLSMGPAILYNVPSRTSQDIPPQIIHSLAQNANFAGIKECVEHERIKHYKQYAMSHSVCLKDSSTFNLSRPSSSYGGSRMLSFCGVDSEVTDWPQRSLINQLMLEKKLLEKEEMEMLKSEVCCLQDQNSNLVGYLEIMKKYNVLAEKKCKGKRNSTYKFPIVNWLIGICVLVVIMAMFAVCVGWCSRLKLVVLSCGSTTLLCKQQCIISTSTCIISTSTLSSISC